MINTYESSWQISDNLIFFIFISGECILIRLEEAEVLDIKETRNIQDLLMFDGNYKIYNQEKLFFSSKPHVQSVLPHFYGATAL